jgi:acyl carrier protein
MSEREDVLVMLQEATDEVLQESAPRLTEAMEIGESSIDSLDLVEILMMVEDREGFVIEGEQIDDVSSIRGVVDAILALRSGNGS